MAAATGSWQAPGPGPEGGSAWVEVAREREAHRLHNRGRFGEPLPGGGLRLHPVEAVYLIEAGRLVMTGESPGLRALRERVSGPLLAAYRDLRDRGLVVNPEARTDGEVLRVWAREAGSRIQPQTQPQYHLHPVDEREPMGLDRLMEWARQAGRRGVEALAGVVDEEGGLTYFSLALAAPGGGGVAAKPTLGEPATAQLEGGLLAVGAPAAREALEAAGYGKPVGPHYRLSLLEGLYLAQTGALGLANNEGALSWAELAGHARRLQPDLGLRLALYRHLRGRGLLPKTGFKFGTHFRVYDKPMGQGHAPWLVHALPAGYEGTWPELARAVRLAHGVRKQLWLARVSEAAVEAALQGEGRGQAPRGAEVAEAAEAAEAGEGVALLEVGWVRP